MFKIPLRTFFQVLLELLALDFPDRHQCGVFDNRAKKSSIDMGNSTGNASSSDTARSTAYGDEEVAQKVDGEKCSIDEEVVLLRRIRDCVHHEQVRLKSFYKKLKLIE